MNGELHDLLDEMRETERYEMFPQQRATAGRYADKLEEILSENAISSIEEQMEERDYENIDVNEYKNE